MKPIVILDFKLYQNYPNPFNPETIISYELEHQTNVKLIIFNSLGEKVQILVDETKSAGTYSIKWDGRDYNNNMVSSGIYFIKLIAENYSSSVKAIFLK